MKEWVKADSKVVQTAEQRAEDLAGNWVVCLVVLRVKMLVAYLVANLAVKTVAWLGLQMVAEKVVMMAENLATMKAEYLAGNLAALMELRRVAYWAER